jgi:predicted transcriptional regulator
MNADTLNTPVSEIMTTKLEAATEMLPMKEAAKLLLSRRVTGLPITTRSGRAVGVLSWSDIIAALGEKPTGPVLHGDVFHGFYTEGDVHVVDTALPPIDTVSGIVRDHMSSRIVSVLPQDSVLTAARTMDEQTVHRVLVTDGEGTLVGLLSAIDIVRYLARSRPGERIASSA